MKSLILAISLAIATAASAAGAKIVFIAGPPSHGPWAHEHRAGCLLLQSCLDQIPGITTVVYTNGWPEKVEGAFDGASAVVVYSDGGGGHPLLRGDHLATMAKLMDKGVGLVCIHYAVEPTLEKGEHEFLDWIGGCFEVNWSVNPDWDADFKVLPKHPITRGVKPFSIPDEWYFQLSGGYERRDADPDRRSAGFDNAAARWFA
jgi:hypothetical protein